MIDNNDATRIFAGFGGAVVGALALDEGRPWRALGMVVCGGLIAAFVIPGLAEHWGIDSAAAVSLLAFLGGLLGMQAAKLAMVTFLETAPAVVAAFIRRVTGVDVPPQRPQGGDHE